MKISALVLFSLLILSALPAQELEVAYACSNPSLNTNQINIWFIISNTGTKNAALSDISLRYFYTPDSRADEEFYVDFAGIGSSNITGTLKAGYLEVGFTPGSGNLCGGTGSGAVYLSLNKKDWSSYYQGDDYSFDPQAETYTVSSRITLYYRGTLVWGNPPDNPDELHPTPTPSL